MTTTNNPAAVQRTGTPNAHGVADGQPTRVLARLGGETKAFYKTTEFIVFIVATVGVLLASFLVKAADGHSDYFAADKAWLYVVILSVGYMMSRGLAKSGSRHHDDA
jgi:hypothetical protein